MLLFAVTFIGYSQDPVGPPIGPTGPAEGCVDFNNQSVGGWQGNLNNTGANVEIASPGPSGATTDSYLLGHDDSGPSYIYNSSEYIGNWNTVLGDNRNSCFCWDFRVFDDANSGEITLLSPSIILVNNPNNLNSPNVNANIRAIFRSSFTTTENAGWLHTCAPIGLCDAAGNLPSNEFGYWEMLDGGDCNDWDALIQDVTAIVLPIDYYPNPSEDIGWDNFCFQNCDQLDLPEINCELVDANFVKGEDIEGECCHDLSLVNNDPNLNYSEVVFTIVSPNVEYSLFNASQGFTVNNSYSGNSNANRRNGITSPNGIPNGNLQDIANMCFSSTNGSELTTVDIEVTWLLEPDSNGIEYIPCRERVTLNCMEMPMEGCCDSLENQIVNGDFEFGAEGFESEYSFENDISVSSILPGSYGVINTEEANSICDNWMVDDHTTNCDGAGNFLVVNGQTGQTGSSIFWGQTIQVDDTTDTYKLCASFKHLEQCCFDVTPTIDVIINGVVVETITIDQTSGADPCSWQDYTYSFSPDNFSVTIQFALDETALGDGNDLAVDDIIIHNLPKAPFYISTQDQRPQLTNIMASYGNISPSPGTADDILPSPECEFEWFVAKIDNIDLSDPSNPIVTFFSGTEQMDGSLGNGGLGWNSLTTSFPLYDGASTPNPAYPVDGNFENGFYYISLTVNECDCYADSTDAKIVGRFGLKGNENETITHFTLSEESLKRMEMIRQGYRNGKEITFSNSFSKEPTTLFFTEKDQVLLSQNEPNPFDNSTTISFYLPENTYSAKLQITSINGSLFSSIPIDQNGHGQVKINTVQYKEGIYFYSLIIDDVVMETKRMVLTR